MSDFKFMKDDLVDRICKFGSDHYKLLWDDFHSAFDIALDDDMFAAATHLFWDRYFNSEVDL